MATGHVNIRFGYFAADTGDAVAPLEIIGDDMKIVRRETLHLDQPISVELEPGTYLVRTWMSSGEIAQSQVSLAANQTKDVDLHPATKSARETLGWAYYLKPTPERASSELGQLMSGPITLGLARESPGIALWTHDQGLSWKQLASNPPSTGWSAPPFINALTRDDTVVYQDRQAALALTIESPDGWRYNLGQCWLQVRLRRHSQFVALPPAEKMRALVLHRDEDDPTAAEAPFEVIVDGGNPRAESILGYLSSGALDPARSVAESVVKSAEQLLFDKRSDPSSAAIAGYFLLKAGRAERRGAWIQNLANWFPWLPDGAVIDGWRLLKQVNPDPLAARERLIDAATRGVPLFTYGLRLLFDGLHLMSQQPLTASPAVTKALALIQPYAAAVDWTRPNTTHYGSTPDDPQPAT